jgi:hypothetical protein
MPALSVQRFWTEYKPDPLDSAKLIEVDKVAYGPVGMLDKSLVVSEVSRLYKTLQPLEGSQDPAVHQAHARWAAIEPLYKAYKSGQEAPLNGTPLAAWNALTPEQADVLRRNGIKTVEEISLLTDVHISRFPMPGLKDLIKQAKNFIDAADQTRFSAKLAEKDNEVAALQAENHERASQVAELMEKVKQLAEIVAMQGATAEDADPDAVPAPRKPGRPPKAQAA